MGGSEPVVPSLAAPRVERFHAHGPPLHGQGVTLMLSLAHARFHVPIQLERAGTVGVIIVVVLIILLAVRAAQAGFPALVSGELPLFGVAQPRALPEAASIIGMLQ